MRVAIREAVIATSLTVAGVVLLACGSPQHDADVPVPSGPASSESREDVQPEPEPFRLPESVGLEDCLRIALERRPLRGMARAEVQMAEADVARARGAYFPSLDLFSRLSRLDEDPTFVIGGTPLDLGRSTEALADALALAAIVDAGIDPAPGNPFFDAAFAQAKQVALRDLRRARLPDIDATIADRDSWSTGLQLTYPLYAGGRIDAASARARAGLGVAKSRSHRTDQDIVLEVSEAYLSVLLAMELKRIADETLTRFEVLLDLTDRLYKAESATVKKTDFLKTKVMTSIVRGRAEVLDRHVDLARSGLLHSMGLDPTLDIRLSDAGLPNGRRDFDEQRLVQDAFRFRPEWEQATLAIVAAEANVSQAKGGHLPNVAAFASVEHMENSFDLGVVPSSENQWAIGLQLQMSIFNGFATSSEVHKAEAELRRAHHQRRLVSNGLWTQVRTEFVKFESARADMETAAESQDDAKENRALNVRAYEAELVETQDVIEAQILEALTALSYAKALFDYDLAVARLEWISGRGPGKAGDLSQ